MTIAQVAPVLNSVAAFILVVKASVLVVVAALVGFWIPEYDPGGEVEGVAILGAVQPISAVAWLAFVTGGNTNSAVSSTGFATLPLVAAPQLARFDAQGQSSPSRIWTPSAAHSIEVLKPEQALAAGPEGALPIEPVVSRMNATLSGCGTPPAASATALAEICT